MPTTRNTAPADAADYIVDDNLRTPYSHDDEDVQSERSSSVQSGWDAAIQRMKSSESQYAQNFKFTEDPQLVKFLEGDPFAVYAEHWVERQGKRSWTCLGPVCPICRKMGVGAVSDPKDANVPRRKVAFSIVNFSAEPPRAEILVTSPRLAETLLRFHTDKLTGPLDRMYYALSKSGVGTSTIYNVLPVKPRDLEEDWGADPSEMEAIVASCEPFDSSVIPTHSREQLEEVVRGYLAS